MIIALDHRVVGGCVASSAPDGHRVYLNRAYGECSLDRLRTRRLQLRRRCIASLQEMPDYRDNCDDQEDMNQSTGNGEDEKSQGPKDEDYHSNSEKHGSSSRGLARPTTSGEANAIAYARPCRIPSEPSPSPPQPDP